MTYRATFHRNRGGRTSYVMVEDHAAGQSYGLVVRNGAVVVLYGRTAPDAAIDAARAAFQAHGINVQ